MFQIYFSKSYFVSIYWFHQINIKWKKKFVKYTYTFWIEDEFVDDFYSELHYISLLFPYNNNLKKKYLNVYLFQT